MAHKTSERIRRFAALYAISLNGRESARLAGYKGKPKALDVTASRLLKHPAVQAAMSRATDRVEASSEEAVGVIAQQMRSDMTDFVDPDPEHGVRVNLGKAYEARKIGLVKKIKQKSTIRTDDDGETIEERTIEFELYDKQAAAVQIAKIKGAYKEADAGALAMAHAIIVNTGILDNDPHSSPISHETPAD